MKSSGFASMPWRLLRGLGGGLAVLALVACVAAGPQGTPRPAPPDDPPPQTGATTPRGDLVTASDETDAQKRARVRLELASAYFAEGQINTALDEVKRALAINPASGAAYNLRGLIYASLDEHRLAEDSFRRALELQPADGDTRHNYGWYLCRLRRYDEAQSQFTVALAQPQYRNQSKTLLAQGVCQARAGDWVSAEKTLTRSYELDAANPSTAINLAEVLMRRGEFDRARFYVARVNAVPELVDAETLWLAARIEQRRGNLDGANEFGAQLKRRFPTSRQAAAFEGGRFDE